ncbi:hypothetical protein TheveDRAFT_1736 [Thermanaerovibrio velox DSM 12556]|uniref:Uncharacterized protein n=1 Tax=Thermanaerovibrio velox DSM 12556 TaxID=926567 RepID=H0UR17_9BACT|nr:hypothetical protein [Thermanaerovibrio velox]EHM10854.1 hypothetical protein TheveDRAFT_1736 [Thermanaerovibrio velox DSM 12556]
MSWQVHMLVNSPGELMGWAAPVAAALRSLGDVSLTAVIPPCQYASGGEAEAARRVADRVYPLGRFLRERPWRDGPGEVRLLRLGGDVKLAVLLGRLMGCPVDAYIGRGRTVKGIRKHLVPSAEMDEAIRAQGGRAVLVGWPVFDALPPSCGAVEGVPVVFMCGSRPFEAVNGLPFMVEAASEMVKALPQITPVFPIAPTLDPQVVLGVLGSVGNPEGAHRPSWVRVSRPGVTFRMRVTWDGALPGNPALWVGFPGTNNLQAAALGVPLLVVLPLNRAWEIPLDGLLGLIPWGLWGLRQLKVALVSRKVRNLPFVSLPNRLAGRPVVPELIGSLEPRDLARAAAELLAYPERKAPMLEAFREMTNLNRGAAMRIARAVLS